MTIEEAREIIEKEDANPSWHGIRIAEYRYARYFLEGYKSGRREALESEAVKNLIEASIDAIKALDNLNPRSRLPNLEKALTRFEQFKQEGKS